MLEFIHGAEAGLGIFVALAKLVLEGISAVCVMIGLAISLVYGFREFGKSGKFKAEGLRLKFGSWLAIALEFQLGADILATTVAPTMDSLIKLAILAAIRTFLNYFLQKELENVEKFHKEI